MPLARILALPLLLWIFMGCGDREIAATLSRADGKPVKALVRTRTGDGIPVPIEVEYPAGTKVTIVKRVGADGAAANRVNVRIDDGQYKGLDAEVDRGDVHEDR